VKQTTLTKFKSPIFLRFL